MRIDRIRNNIIRRLLIIPLAPIEVFGCMLIAGLSGAWDGLKRSVSTVIWVWRGDK